MVLLVAESVKVTDVTHSKCDQILRNDNSSAVDQGLKSLCLCYTGESCFSEEN